MKLRQKIRRNTIALNFVAVLASATLATASFADSDYSRIKRDISVMTDIIKSAFKSTDDCKNCNVRISGHYLADQGVVFNIDPSSTGFSFAPQADVEFVTRGFVSGLPDMVGDILEEVQINLDDAEHSWEWNTDGDFTRHDGVSREVRGKLRESRREMRELARQLREIAIESIHAEDKELEKLKAREAELESEVAAIEEKQMKLEESLNKEAELRALKHEERREAKREKQRAKVEAIETIVLNTFCDYSSTLRSIPRNEKLSLIIKQDKETSNVFVFDQSELNDCDSSKTDVRSKALAYVF